MIKQMIERLNLVIEGDPTYHPILDEIFKLIGNLDNLSLLDQLISKLKNILS